MSKWINPIELLKNDPVGLSFDTIDRWYKYLSELPTEDVRPNVKGYWRHEATTSELRSCSVCGYTTHAVGVYAPHQTAFPQRILFNYCPCCGADMRGGGE